MSPAHLHLVVNHLPIFGSIFLLLAALWAWFRHSREMLRFIFACTALLGLASWGVYLTGEPAEEQLEDLPWVQERLIHEHEESAEAGLIAALVAGAIGLGALFASRGDRPLRPVLTGGVVLGLAVSSTLFGLAGLNGGVIRHDELRPASPSGVGTPVPGAAAGERERDER